MKKTGIIIILAIVVIAFLWGMGAYNGLVTTQENVNSQWGNVENQYQRRADLVPNLVATVKGYATHEKSTFDRLLEDTEEYVKTRQRLAKLSTVEKTVNVSSSIIIAAVLFV